MIRRLVIALVALLIAAIGGVLTFLYASGADARAIARMQPVQVLVVAEPIAEGTPSEDLARSLTATEIPAAAVVPGGVTDLNDVAGLQTSTDLQPGEQLIASRFVAPEAVSGEVDVPPDMHELSIQLDTQRVIGGDLQPGDTVGVFVSATAESAADGDTEAAAGQMTRLMLHKVLVTAVSGGLTTSTDENGEEVENEAAAAIVVTLALSPADAERVVFAQEFASVWLSLEGAEVPEDGTGVVDAEVIFG